MIVIHGIRVLSKTAGQVWARPYRDPLTLGAYSLFDERKTHIAQLATFVLRQRRDYAYPTLLLGHPLLHFRKKW